jgi:hypothetical protein
LKRFAVFYRVHEHFGDEVANKKLLFLAHQGPQLVEDFDEKDFGKRFVVVVGWVYADNVREVVNEVAHLIILELLKFVQESIEVFSKEDFSGTQQVKRISLRIKS